jgi:DNA polymerase-3 subunit alpha
VRFGLSAIKGIGKGAMQEIVAERRKSGPFKSIYDFCERVSSRTLNKAAMEALVKCGAFDSLHGQAGRAAACAALDDAIAAGQTAAEDARAGQMNFFAAIAETTPAAARIERKLPNVTPWNQRDALKNEKDVLGFHVSGHPLDDHESTLRIFATCTAANVANLNHDTAVIIGGQLASVRPTFVKQGKSAGEKMAMITLQDKSGQIDGVVFSSVFARCGAMLQADSIVLLIGRVDRMRGEPQIIADNVIAIADAPKFLAGRIEIDLLDDREGESLDARMQMVAGYLQQAGAAGVVNGCRAADIYLFMHDDRGQRYALRCNRLRAVAEPALLATLRDLVGESHVRVVSGGIPRRNGEGANGQNGNGYAKKWNREAVAAEA